MKRDFLHITDYSKDEFWDFIEKSSWIKNKIKDDPSYKPFAHKTLAMIFAKPSARTRVSFEVAINQLGGNSVNLNPKELQISRGETINDTVKALSQYLDGIIIRCFSHSLMLEFAKHSSIPVINGLTDTSHPCQVLSDLFTIYEHFGKIENQKITWLGDGNNVAKSWIDIAKISDIELTISTPRELAFSESIIKTAIAGGANIQYQEDPIKAVKSADVVTTDTWISMGDNEKNQHNFLKPYQVNDSLIKMASKNAVFMHCLPATRGKEVSTDVLDGKNSIIWTQAENRLHVQRSIFSWCFDEEFGN